MGMSIEEMKNVDVRTVDSDTLVDVTQINTLTKPGAFREICAGFCTPISFSESLDKT